MSLWTAVSGCTDLSLCSEGLCAASAPSMADATGSGGRTTTSSSPEPSGGGGGGGGATSSTSIGGSASTSTGGGSSISTSAGGGGGATSSSSTASGGGPPTAATIIALQPNNTPVADVEVVVNDAEGAVVLRALTDVEGRVGLSIPHGGSATVYRTAPSPQPLTIVSPPDGALIRVPVEPTVALPPSGTAFKATATGAQLALTFFGSCGAKAQPSTTLDFTCARAGTHPTTEAIVAVASTSTGVPAAWGSAPSLAVVPGESVDVELTVANTDFASIDVTITHVALDAVSAAVELRSLASQLGVWGPIVSHQKSWTYPVGDLSFRAKVPAVSWGFLLKEKLAVAAGPASRELWRERHLSALPSESELAGNTMPPLALAPLDMSEPAHPRLDWEVASGPVGEITVATMDFGDGETATRWTAWLPPEASGRFRLPDVPADLKPPALTPALPPVTSMVACAKLEGVDSYAEALSTGAAAWVLGQDSGAGSFTATAGVLKSAP